MIFDYSWHKLVDFLEFNIKNTFIKLDILAAGVLLLEKPLKTDKNILLFHVKTNIK